MSGYFALNQILYLDITLLRTARRRRPQPHPPSSAMHEEPFNQSITHFISINLPLHILE